MRSGKRNPLVFLATCLLTSATWFAFWPMRKSPAAVPSSLPRTPVEVSWDRRKLDPLIAALERAASNQEKLDAVLRLAEIPAQDIPLALEGIELKDGRDLSLAAKTLLIRWASTDGEAAMKWAWLRFRLDSQWREAFRQIGPAWAWRDPEGMGRWITGSLALHPVSPDGANIAQAAASNEPIFSFDDITRISGWLLHEDPLAAYTVFLKRGGWSTGDGFMWKQLDDPQQIQKALLAFDNLEVLRTRDVTKSFSLGPEMYAESLMCRWLDLDPDGFSNSAYAPYLSGQLKSKAVTSAVGDWKSLPPEERAKAANRVIREPGSSLYGSASRITREWVASDPDACRQWLESLPEDQVLWPAQDYVENRAAGGHVAEALDWITRFKPELREICFIKAFDAWTAAGSGNPPDMSSWNEERKQAWEDLAALQAAGSP